MNVYFNQGQQQYEDGNKLYNDQSYSPTVGLDDRVITGGKMYPVLPNRPRNLPISPYTGQEYDPAWATPKYGTNPPKSRRRSSGLPRKQATKAAYNSHWIDVPFVFAWVVWFVMLGLPTMVLAAGLTSGLPREYGAVGAIVWFLFDIIASFIATYISRKLHARKASTRRYTGDHRWIDRRG